MGRRIDIHVRYFDRMQVRVGNVFYIGDHADADAPGRRQSHGFADADGHDRFDGHAGPADRRFKG